MKNLKIAFFALIWAIFPIAQTFSQDSDLFSEEGNWDIYQYNKQEDPNCMAFLEFVFEDGVDGALGFVHYGDLIIFSITQSDWALPVDEVYDVFLQFDAQENLSVSALVTDENTLSFVEDFTDWVASANNPSIFHLHTPQTTFSYDVSGLEQANKVAGNCIYQTLNPAGSNPFLTNKANSSNPFIGGTSREVLPNNSGADFVLEPTVAFDAYSDLMKYYESEEVTVKVQLSTFNIGSYEALLADSLYNLYWEENTSTRTTARVFGDFSARISDQCVNLATNLVSEIKFENHDFYKGSIACSLRSDPETTLYFRLSIYEFSGKAMLFLTFGNVEDQDLVDLLDDDLDLNDSLSESLRE